MSGIDSFSGEYRNKLATHILSTQNRVQRRDILANAQPTLDYSLAKNERKVIKAGENFESLQLKNQRVLQGEPIDTYPSYFMSNEPYLFKLFPVINDVGGGVVGVGSDQVLDILVNSKADLGIFVDITQGTSLITRSLMEVGLRHKKTFGKYPTPEEFVRYFRGDNLHHLKRFLQPIFSDEELKMIMTRFEKGRSTSSLSSDRNAVPYEAYLEFKKNARDDKGQHYSWLGSEQNLAKVLSMYEQGKIYIIHRDIYTDAAAQTIKDILSSHNKKMGILYLSNTEFYQNSQPNLSNLLETPIEKNGVVLRTTRDLGHTLFVGDDTMDNRLSQIMTDWHYNAQKLANYFDQIKRNKKYNRHEWLSYARSLTNSRSAISFLDFPPQELPHVS